MPYVSIFIIANRKKQSVSFERKRRKIGACHSLLMSTDCNCSTGTMARARRCYSSTDSPALATTGGTVFGSPLSGYRTIAPDLRGHGRSTNPSGVFRFADVARDVFALLDRLTIERVKAIGMSAGANTLLHMATQQPDRISAMIHVSGTPRFPDPARGIMSTMTEETRSDGEWADMRTRHHYGDNQIRALWRHAREFANDREDMNFTPITLSSIGSCNGRTSCSLSRSSLWCGSRVRLGGLTGFSQPTGTVGF